jgi:predicted MFS family arabinose efflux permease
MTPDRTVGEGRTMSIPQQSIPQQSIPQQPTPQPSRWALAVTAGAGFVAGLDTTAVNLALPDIHEAFAAGLTELQWVVNAFALLSAALLVTAGDLSDRFGRRRVFVSGLLAFAGSSAICGISSSALMLDLARAAQGAAAAVVTAGGWRCSRASIRPRNEAGRWASPPPSRRCPSWSARSWAACSPTPSDGGRCSS